MSGLAVRRGNIASLCSWERKIKNFRLSDVLFIALAISQSLSLVTGNIVNLNYILILILGGTWLYNLRRNHAGFYFPLGLLGRVAFLSLSALVYGFFYQGNYFSQYIEPFFLICIFMVFLETAHKSLSRDALLKMIPLLYPVVICAHFVIWLTNGAGVALEVGSTGARYGYLNEINLVNITATSIVFWQGAFFVSAIGSKSSSPIMTLMGTVTTVVSMLLVISTGSRGALLMSIVLVVFFAINSLMRSRKKIPIAASLIFMIILVPLLLSRFEGVDSYFRDRFLDSLSSIRLGEDESTKLRWDTLVYAFNLSSSSLFIGHNLLDSEVIGHSADNFLAFSMLGYGILGLVILSTFFIKMVFNVFKKWNLIILAIAPFFVRATFEGMYIERSLLFPSLLFLVALRNYSEYEQVRRPMV